ncbi:hypothetical protein NA57DRAFT_55845 [Rhizodiscina lignyota]|uniref:Uncharacterized protein n=1 Tax=Rhizodiscina lignyota TaxID=1504668 RepID=A0A9P4MA08_9PEZI|nr:hypothetical protein NA57DRAFT_55845 [Rhizodiscina lignyota]
MTSTARYFEHGILIFSYNYGYWHGKIPNTSSHGCKIGPRRVYAAVSHLELWSLFISIYHLGGHHRTERVAASIHMIKLLMFLVFFYSTIYKRRALSNVVDNDNVIPEDKHKQRGEDDGVDERCAFIVSTTGNAQVEAAHLCTWQHHKSRRLRRRPSEHLGGIGEAIATQESKRKKKEERREKESGQSWLHLREATDTRHRVKVLSKAGRAPNMCRLKTTKKELTVTTRSARCRLHEPASPRAVPRERELMLAATCGAECGRVSRCEAELQASTLLDTPSLQDPNPLTDSGAD